MGQLAFCFWLHHIAYRVTVEQNLQHNLLQISDRYGQNLCLYTANLGILIAKSQWKGPMQNVQDMRMVWLADNHTTDKAVRLKFVQLKKGFRGRIKQTPLAALQELRAKPNHKGE